MVWAVRPVHASSPDRGAEDYHGQEEENAGYLQPQDSAYTAEGAQKAADTASKTARSLARNLAGGAGLSSGGCGLRRWMIGAGLGGRGHALPGNASGDAESDTKSAADGLRLHFDLMVTARLPIRLSTDYRTENRTMPVALKRRWK
jgi:hypothetical protein